MRFDHGIEKRYRRSVEEAFDAILAQGNDLHREIIGIILESEMLVRVQPVSKVKASGVTGLIDAGICDVVLGNRIRSRREALSGGMPLYKYLANRLLTVTENMVTGENLGQVASQTIENLTAIEAAARRVVLRPLVTYDKVETTALARRIGTYETSILPYEDCCSLFLPIHPATRARAVDAEKVEAQVDVAAEIAAAVAGSERISV